ncbi:uncharacterized protein STEHIDRAFT_55559 [Stereum hirsutum FP-91666 SS1]|uniref:uncharacterized protein n=1 Tax=Stereum hirsutum (strain FP-91666) TaxID=721885 RepID=UPI000440BDD5|nr:uncharacterized protein STEHIDRAFT_55559 [Stereum hirsutum FP-91666 SS1]EIM88046.1 hypothetical protein STEHIDRAFT_55559 [Stereum hirsutum FP-91666 SS1]
MSKKATSKSSPTSGRGTQSSDLYKFHRPKLNLHDTPHPLKRESRHALRNLASCRSVRPSSPLPFYPRSQCAAVLVALFVGRMGDLYVLLSRRAETLRSYAGDTALPGGKVEPDDRTIEDTARREAFEEIGLPRDRHKVPLLCVLEPFLVGNNILVTPVVVLILDNTLRPILNTPEVHTLFSHPLASFLSTSAPFTSTTPDDGHVGKGEMQGEDTGDENKEHYIRMHQFLTGREQGGVKPVYGVTSAILIHIAAQAYRHPPAFDIQAPNQPSMHERIAWALLHVPQLREACEKEGVDPVLAADGWIKEGRRVGKEERNTDRGRRRKSAALWARL